MEIMYMDIMVFMVIAAPESAPGHPCTDCVVALGEEPCAWYAWCHIALVSQGA